jgi:hypothetical protein
MPPLIDSNSEELTVSNFNCLSMVGFLSRFALLDGGTAVAGGLRRSGRVISGSPPDRSSCRTMRSEAAFVTARIVVHQARRVRQKVAFSRRRHVAVTNRAVRRFLE